MQPRVKDRRIVLSNRWISLLEKDVEFEHGVEQFYSIEQPDYVGVVALTASGQMPLIRQYRPAVEEFTLELPAGHVDPGEDPRQAAVRELREETGLKVLSCESLGRYLPDSGRLSNRCYLFRARTAEAPENFVAEEGLEVIYVSPEQLARHIAAGEFTHLMHLAAVYLSGFLPSAETGPGLD